jgi:hydroxymethylpyrimidine/phosphomethylpyrimidine kinase
VPNQLHRACGLTIAGSDSGGGAGIQADLKTFAALGLHGTSVITCITAQNPKEVLGIQAVETAMVKKQLVAVFSELRPQAVKTGMLYSVEIVREIAAFFSSVKRIPPLIIDPVLVAGSGARLLQTEAIEVLQRELLPLAWLVTPNLVEAEILLDLKIDSVGDLRQAARQVHKQFGCAALVKGGHLQRMREAVDFFYDGRTELLLSAPFIRGMRTHGTGCTYSAAIAAYCALGCALPKAVERGKEFITRAIWQSRRVGRHQVLNVLRNG